MKFAGAGIIALLFCSCTIGRTIDCLDDRCPPPELGRPTWVRVCAGTGAWIGGILGGIASIIVLPITYPLSVLADDGLGEHAASEFMLLPAMGCAAVGHAFFGGPPDVLDYVFRRAWVNAPDPVTSYSYVPLPGAVVTTAPRSEAK